MTDNVFTQMKPEITAKTNPGSKTQAQQDSENNGDSSTKETDHNGSEASNTQIKWPQKELDGPLQMHCILAGSKQCAHIWELGGGASLGHLLASSLTAENLPYSSVFVFGDLSKPEELWYTLETTIKHIRKHCDLALKSMTKQQHQAMEEMQHECLPLDELNTHADASQVKPLPIPLILIGGKYDKLNELDKYGPEAKMPKWHTVLGNPNDASGVSTDNRPLLVPCAADSFGSIGFGSYEQCREAILAKWPQNAKLLSNSESQVQSEGADPKNDPTYKEDLIDRLRIHKDQGRSFYFKIYRCIAVAQELQRFIRQQDMGKVPT